MDELETTLMKLAQHGTPRVSLHTGGWYCAVDMYVKAAGSKFEVASTFKNPTPLSAAQQCAERVDAMLRGFASDNPKAITHG